MVRGGTVVVSESAMRATALATRRLTGRIRITYLGGGAQALSLPGLQGWASPAGSTAASHAHSRTGALSDRPGDTATLNVDQTDAKVE